MQAAARRAQYALRACPPNSRPESFCASRFRAVHHFLLCRVMLSEQPLSKDPSLSFWLQQRGFMFCQCSARDPLVVKLHCVACSTSGSRRGSWLLQVQANLVALCVLPMLQNGVHARLEVGGVSLFCARFDRVLVLAVRLEVRVCVALRLQLFLRMRLRVTVSVLVCLAALLSQCRWCCCLSRCVGVGQGPRSPPAFCRAAGHRAPGEASCELVSMLGFCTKCQCFSLICYEGPAFRASPCWLAALRGVGGALGCFRFMQKEFLFVFCRCFRTGCPGCACFCVRLDFQVTVSVLAGESRTTLGF